MAQQHHITIYTDGASTPQHELSPGGWGAVLVATNANGEIVKERELSGGLLGTTNNAMELTACIKGLEVLSHPCVVTLVTDSEYVRQGITTWIHNWFSNGWRTSNRQPVKNRELWQALHLLNQTHRVTWEWTRGHDGHEYNERADALAVAAKQQMLAKVVS